MNGTHHDPTPSPPPRTPPSGVQTRREHVNVYKLVAKVHYGIPVDASGPVEATVAAILRHLAMPAAGS